MSWQSDKHNVTLVFALIIVLVTFKRGHGADVGVHSTRNLHISSHNSLQSNYGKSIATKLLYIRQIFNHFSNWSSGESGLQGTIARTFGRIRMIRKIMLPLAFMGGFLTAIILGIKLTGTINMLLITKVLLLQFALVLGKILWGAKELLTKKHDYYPQPFYYPIPHESHLHSSSFGHRRDDNLNQQSFYYGQQPFNLPTSIIQQPHINQPSNYLPIQGYQPQPNLGQPQSNLLSGFLPTTHNHSPPHYQDHHLNNLETLETKSVGSFIGPDTPTALKFFERPQSTSNLLTPQQMTELLQDAIAQMSLRTKQVSRRIKRSPSNFKS